MSGWIKLHRSLSEWEWYDDINATRLLIHFLISVNYEDKKWKGINIPAGSLVFSYDTLSNKVNLSVQQIRTALKKIESSGEVTRKATNKYQLVTLVKWEKLQQSNEDSNKQTPSKATGEQQASNRLATTTKEYNNIISKETIVNREADFKKSLQPFLETYGKDVLNEFYLYWTEKKPKGRKMKYEMQKTFDVSRRLARWIKNDFNNNNNLKAENNEQLKNITTNIRDNNPEL